MVQRRPRRRTDHDRPNTRRRHRRRRRQTVWSDPKTAAGPTLHCPRSDDRRSSPHPARRFAHGIGTSSGAGANPEVDDLVFARADGRPYHPERPAAPSRRRSVPLASPRSGCTTSATPGPRWRFRPESRPRSSKTASGTPPWPSPQHLQPRHPHLQEGCGAEGRTAPRPRRLLERRTRRTAIWTTSALTRGPPHAEAMKPGGQLRTLGDVTGDQEVEAVLWTRSLNGDAGRVRVHLRPSPRPRLPPGMPSPRRRRRRRTIRLRRSLPGTLAAPPDVRLVHGSVPALAAGHDDQRRTQHRPGVVVVTAPSWRSPRAERAPDAATEAVDGAPRWGSSLKSGRRWRSLPEQDLHLFCLVALEDLSLADAAAVLNITPSAAKDAPAPVRERLRVQLGDFATPSTTPGGSR